MSVFAELKRRNVVRVAVLYGLVAWLILQVAEVLFDVLELPTWAGKLVFGLLALGFPLALIFSWVYELTPEGLKREHEVDRNQSITHETGRKLDYVIGGLAVLAIAAVLADRFIPRAARTSDASAAATGASPAKAPASAKSIAVLPFVNMSGEAENEYFADGLSEELLNVLARIPDLRVAARTSAFKFKGEKVDLQDVARQLNVSHVLEGSVRRSGNKVRITAQLINAADGYHMWSQTYDRTLDDIFVVQDDIAGEVVKALKVTLLGTKSVTRSRPVDPEAYKLTLQGRFFGERRGKQELARAVEFFQRARERDPDYAPAWAGLSDAYAQQVNLGFVPAADGVRRAREAAEKAIALDPRLVDGHLALGWIQRSFDWDWAAADTSFRTALELEPGNTQTLRHASIQARSLGRWDEATDLINKAIERDPLRPAFYHNLGLVLLATHRAAEAETMFRKALALDPVGAWRHMGLGRALLQQGKPDAALREMQQETDEGWRLFGLALAYHALGRRKESDASLAALKETYAGDSAFQIAEVHAFRGETDLAFDWLDRAYRQRDAGLTEILGDQLLRGIVRDPRYKALLRKIKLPE